MTSTSTTAKRRFSFRRKAASPLADGHHKKTFWQRVYRDRYLLLLFLPCLIYYILFKYVPMWGVLISFKDFKPFIGFMGSDWVGLKHYVNFFSRMPGASSATRCFWACIPLYGVSRSPLSLLWR